MSETKIHVVCDPDQETVRKLLGEVTRLRDANEVATALVAEFKTLRAENEKLATRVGWAHEARKSAEAEVERVKTLNRDVAKRLMRTMERATAAENEVKHLRARIADEIGSIGQEMEIKQLEGKSEPGSPTAPEPASDATTSWTPEDVPPVLVQAAHDGWWSAAGQGLDWEAWLRVEIAAVLTQLGLREEFGVQSEDSERAQPCDDLQHASHLADRYSRFLTFGGGTIQHHVVRHLATSWERA
ncbi:hypothetical protein Caci_3005 [Catenulispora acidiphila DSM 44928]|uniref:Uncharacterized protein n=1 Tax=Catenulispora acidiphila (strain DSM 44928 / JCM 14897 / NBRC 102108 / NRRL B-24433 / ID139908) TaxID=479433 RepID=C7Q322_CATAD|nr:hypothetical protein [Catenulispora acidiphila]ACU71914.1 hypothetical protein Caci_3005 [Catenulispora acidiphila DSM 44928]